MNTTKPFQLGSISTGTLKTEDLILVFETEMTDLGKDELHTDFSGMTDEEYLEKLSQILNDICPPFVYFGAHPGDGADFGFWPDWDALDIMLNEIPSAFQAGHIYNCDHCIVHYEDSDAPDKLTVMDLDRQVLWSTV